MTFDSSQPGTSAATWAADSRTFTRTAFDLGGVDELLVVAAHPDDETLGAGGLIAECARKGIPVSVVVVTDGSAAGDPQRRSRELRDAVAVLAPDAEVRELKLPDGGVRERRDDVAEALSPIVEGTSLGALIVAPWRGDGHRDHRVVGQVCAELASAASRRFAEYPIWMWHWSNPDDPSVPWDSLNSVPVNVAIKRAALAEYSSQTEGHTPVLRADFLEHFDREYLIVAPRQLDGAYFDELYNRKPDPWGFETRWYEQRKRALTVAMLPVQRYGRALEIGCSIGTLTDLLAERCDDLLAVDVSQSAVDRARARVGDRAQVERVDVLAAYPDGQFDLIVLSEVGYYFGHEGLATVLTAIKESLGGAGTLLACHWRHPVTDYPLSGDEVHAALGRMGLARVSTYADDDLLLEVYSRDARSVAQRTGLQPNESR